MPCFWCHPGCFSVPKENVFGSCLFQIFIGVQCFKGSWLNEWINRQLNCFMLNYIFIVLCCSFTMTWDQRPLSRMYSWDYGKTDLGSVAESKQQEVTIFRGFLWAHLAGERRESSFLCRLVVAMTTQQQPLWCVATVTVVQPLVSLTTMT